MAHYHMALGEKTSEGKPSGDGHFHDLKDGSKTSVDPNSPDHTHTLPDNTITGLPVEIRTEAFSDIQNEVASIFGHKPEDVYPETL